MTDEFFSSICDLPSLPEVDGLFIQDCDIKPAPDPIRDCDLPDILPDPPINPTAFNSLSIPCPEIDADLDLTVTGDATGSGTLVAVPKSGVCGYDFTLDLDINVTAPEPLPPICPTLTASTTITVHGAYGTASVVATELEDCSYEFAFTFEFWFNSNSASSSSDSESCACLPYCDPYVYHCVPRDAKLVINGCGQIVGWYDSAGTWVGMPFYASESNSIPDCPDSSSSLSSSVYEPPPESSSSSSVSIPTDCNGVCYYEYVGPGWTFVEEACGTPSPGFPTCTCPPPFGPGDFVGEIRAVGCTNSTSPPPP